MTYPVTSMEINVGLSPNGNFTADIQPPLPTLISVRLVDGAQTGIQEMQYKQNRIQLLRLVCQFAYCEA